MTHPSRFFGSVILTTLSFFVTACVAAPIAGPAVAAADTQPRASEVVLERWGSGSPRKIERVSPEAKQVIYFYENGGIEVSFPYDAAGEIDGTLRGYYSDGTVAEISHWAHGKIRDGRWTNKDGTLESEVVGGSGARLLLYQETWQGDEIYVDGEYSHGGG